MHFPLLNSYNSNIRSISWLPFFFDCSNINCRKIFHFLNQSLRNDSLYFYNMLMTDWIFVRSHRLFFVMLRFFWQRLEVLESTAQLPKDEHDLVRPLHLSNLLMNIIHPYTILSFENLHGLQRIKILFYQFFLFLWIVYKIFRLIIV